MAPSLTLRFPSRGRVASSTVRRFFFPFPGPPTLCDFSHPRIASTGVGMGSEGLPGSFVLLSVRAVPHNTQLLPDAPARRSAAARTGLRRAAAGRARPRRGRGACPTDRPQAAGGPGCGVGALSAVRLPDGRPDRACREQVLRVVRRGGSRRRHACAGVMPSRTAPPAR